MTKDKIKEVMDACYQAKRIRDMLPALPGGVTPSHIHYLDTLSKLEKTEGKVKVSDISENLGLPRPSVTKTVKIWKSLDLSRKKQQKRTEGLFILRRPGQEETWLINMLMNILVIFRKILEGLRMKMQTR